MKRLIVGVAVLVAASWAVASIASASHSWGGYHWATRGTGFSLVLGNNLTSDGTTNWPTLLSNASSQWSASDMLNTSLGSGNDPGRLSRKCAPTSGRDEICNYKYGNNGWLGVAQIWLSNGHIVQGTVKVNDTYLGAGSSYTYNNSAERQHVICQEVGHTFGLDHQSTSGASFGTCMDYYQNTSASDTKGTTPDKGDYDELDCIYNKADAGTTLTYSGDATHHSHSCTGTGHDDGFIGAGAAAVSGAAAGLPASANRHESVYVAHLRNGLTRVTFVRWAHPHAHSARASH
jgi:hypothetical protein